MTPTNALQGLVLAACLLAGTAVAMAAAPPAAQSKAKLQTQLKGVDAQLATARSTHDALQAQVAQLEQHNADQQKQIQQRDAKIAALQQRLRDAGVPASGTSAGH